MQTQRVILTSLALCLFSASTADAAALFTRVRYIEDIIGTSSASVDGNNWITASANAFHAAAVDQYHYYPGTPAYDFPTSQVDGNISDTYTLNPHPASGLNAGDVVPVTIAFDVDYSVEITGTSGYTYSVQTQMTGDAGASAGYTESRNSGGGISTTGNPNVSFSQIIGWTVGTSKNLAFNFNIFSAGSGGSAGGGWVHATQALIHAENTAAIGFDLPEGVTMTSELGWTPVPEPTGISLLAVASLVGLRRQRGAFT